MRTVAQLRQQIDTQAEIITRLSVENLRLSRRVEMQQLVIDQMRETQDAGAVSRAWADAERHFIE